VFDVFVRRLYAPCAGFRTCGKKLQEIQEKGLSLIRFSCRVLERWSFARIRSASALAGLEVFLRKIEFFANFQKKFSKPLDSFF
jgi:hypothetical protein